MFFEAQKHKDGVLIVRGFRDERDESYIMVMTIFCNGQSAHVEGFLSKCSLSAFELVALWRFLKETLAERFIACEVVPHHAKIYKEFLHVVWLENFKMFNGKDRIRMMIDMGKGINHFFFNKAGDHHE